MRLRLYDVPPQVARADRASTWSLLAERYGQYLQIQAGQTDNEYGCHDTILSYSNAARQAFPGWLRARSPRPGNDGDSGPLNDRGGNGSWPQV